MLELLAIPHRGVGPFVFGSSKSEIMALMGRPDTVEASEDPLGENQEEWHFKKLHVTLTFTAEDDWKLSSIAVTGSNCILRRIRFIGQDSAELPVQCKTAGIDDLREDGDYGEFGRCFVSDKFGLMFWTMDGCVTKLDLFPLFDETGDYIYWPEPASNA